MLPLDILFDHHARHYEPGTLARFREWFGRSGCGDMLDNPFLQGGSGPRRHLQDASPTFGGLAGVSFFNASPHPWSVNFTPMCADGESVKDLFQKFIRCTGHTHPIGDFRQHLGYFTKILAGPRYFMFHGAGSCLLLGAMFQACASRQLGEHVDLFYSHAARREFTHVFGTWRDRFFVDPDQKTWAPLKAIDDVPSLGYIFQQFGVAGHFIYLELSDAERDRLFASMTRDYFHFYIASTQQYMYRPRHEIPELARLFREARTGFCSPFSVDAQDFPWKDELRRQARAQGVDHPFFMVRAGNPIDFDVPPGGALCIGVSEDDLPDECNILGAIFLGRAPASITVPLAAGIPTKIEVPEFPWLLAFDHDVGPVTINNVKLKPWPSRNGRHWCVGMGDLERVFDLAGGHDRYPLEISTLETTSTKVVLPFNVFALAADLLRCKALPGPGRVVEGRLAI